jgi:predicted RNA-binding Zn ribbon-like protein
MANPAPGDLDLVRRFVNTVDLESGVDRFADAASLQEWLQAHDLIPQGETISSAELERAIEFREALRALAIANAGHGDVPGNVLEALNRIAAAATLAVKVDEDGNPRLEAVASGVDLALGRLLAIVLTAGVDGTWARLKACHNDRCQWLYYDRSKNRSGRWCSMEACGNTINARAYRARRKGGNGAD